MFSRRWEQRNRWSGGGPCSQRSQKGTNRESRPGHVLVFRLHNSQKANGENRSEVFGPWRCHFRPMRSPNLQDPLKGAGMFLPAALKASMRSLLSWPKKKLTSHVHHGMRKKGGTAEGGFLFYDIEGQGRRGDKMKRTQSRTTKEGGNNPRLLNAVYRFLSTWRVMFIKVPT